MPDFNQTGFRGGIISPRKEFAEDDVLFHSSVKDAVNWAVTQQGSMLTRCGSQEVGLCQDGTVRLFRLPNLDPSRNDAIVEVGDVDIAVWVNDSRIVIISTPNEWIGSLDRIQTAYDAIGDDGGAANSGRLIMVHPSLQPKRLYLDNLNVWTFVDMHAADLPAEWSASNYPWTVGLFQNRVWYVGSPVNRTNFWASKAGAPETIGPAGTNPIDPLNFVGIMEGTPVWTIASSDVLTVGTSVDEYQLTAVGGGAINALNALLRRSSSHSSSRIQSRSAEEQVMFASRSQAKVYSINYVRAQDNWKAEEISLPAEHLFTPVGTSLNRSIVNMIHLPDSDKGLWVLLGNGEVNYCCFDKTTDTKAWTKFEFGAPVMDIAAGFSPESDNMYMAVKRNKVISGVQKEYTVLEKVAAPRSDWRRADGWIQASVDVDGTVNDIDRYIGKTAVVFSEFGQEGEVKVTEEDQVYKIPFYDNSIDYYIGYVIDNKVVTLPPAIGNIKQSMSGSTMRTISAQLALYRSVLPIVDGEDPDDRGTEEIMDERTLDFSRGTPDDGANNLKPVYRPRGWEKEGKLTIEVREPFLCEVVSILSEVQANRI
ncbi:tail protein [Vibrio phage K225]|nr:hypothetical protein PODOV044v1_p0017 [Vibrio phage 23E28.1]QZI92074.1 hypothetical protein PODOV045v1_p0032 [Vibrio phage 69E27.1]